MNDSKPGCQVGLVLPCRQRGPARLGLGMTAPCHCG
jgi:hypothetical protein